MRDQARTVHHGPQPSALLVAFLLGQLAREQGVNSFDGVGCPLQRELWLRGLQQDRQVLQIRNARALEPIIMMTNQRELAACRVKVNAIEDVEGNL